jgi:DNA-directed RNA polymerase specialized sigma24 family protein
LLRLAFEDVEEEVSSRRRNDAPAAGPLDEPAHDREEGAVLPASVRRLLEVLPVPGPLRDEVIRSKAFQEHLEIQLNRLPRGPALALLYHDVEGMTDQEVAGLFHISEEEARHWVRLARARLAEALVKHGWVDVPPVGSLFRPPAGEE